MKFVCLCASVNVCVSVLCVNVLFVCFVSLYVYLCETACICVFVIFMCVYLCGCTLMSIYLCLCM